MSANTFYLRTQKIKTVQMRVSTELKGLHGPGEGSFHVGLHVGASILISSKQHFFDQFWFQLDIECVVTKRTLKNLQFGSAQSLTLKGMDS